MNNILCHIVGMDESGKNDLKKNINPVIKIIDLDEIQQQVYNNKDIVNEKKEWEKISQEIVIKKKQIKLIGGSKKNVTNKIDKLLSSRNKKKRDIHKIWREKITNVINELFEKFSSDKIVVIGSNIFPKDYRIKIKIDTPNLSINYKNDNIGCNLIALVNSKKYASNQIKFYLDKYKDRIIDGKFPLKFLEHDTIEKKYEKFINFFEKNKYSYIDENDVQDVINKISEQYSFSKSITQDKIYVATLYNSGDTIPINSKMPMQGFLKRQDAINYIKTKIKKNVPIYVYQVDINQFTINDGKFMANNTLYPDQQESVMLTSLDITE